MLGGSMAVVLRSLFPGVDWSTPESTIKTAFPGIDIPKLQAQFQAIVEWTERVDAQNVALLSAVAAMHGALTELRADLAEMKVMKNGNDSNGPGARTGPRAIGDGKSKRNGSH